jgi:hypothetical protein
MLLVFRKRLAGRPRPAQAGLRLEVFTRVACAARFLEDVSCDAIDRLKLPYI